MNSYVLIFLIAIIAVVLYLVVTGKKKKAYLERNRRYSEIQKMVKSQKAFVKDTLDLYLESHDCPCDWPQFVYWCGKKQGPGWQDGIQNDLVSEALKLPCFKNRQEIKGRDGYEEHFVCSSCGAKWKFNHDEWRMGAFHLILTRLDQEGINAESYNTLVGETIFRTVGYSPDDTRKSLSLREWRGFMLKQPSDKSKDPGYPDGAAGI